MSITSLQFIVFAFATIIVYYIVPKRFQWIVLLLANFAFYYSVGWKASLFVMFTAISVFIAAKLMNTLLIKQRAYISSHKDTISKEEKKALKRKNQKCRKAIMLCALLLNIGILCVTKYAHFAVNQINSIFSLFGWININNGFNVIVPLGISFYTFQTVGYLLDVYWEKIEPQNNFLKFLLFVSFFPQMTQGPISDYESLSNELFAEHKFEYKNYAYGMQRLLWGFAKKLLVADVMSVYVSNLSHDYNSYTGITTLLGVFCYAIQIYADFSGYMDIMCGLCETLGIRLKENFDRPYFSKSIAEYWRRWHITLGEWFKKYIYYPIGMSDWSRSIAKKTKQRFGTHFSNSLPATIALLVVWTATGLWHGASWGYIIWGLLNGAFIIFSLWMEPVYNIIKTKLHIKNDSRVYQGFQVVRTFILVALIKILPEVGGLHNGLGLLKHIFTNFDIPSSLSSLFAFVSKSKTWFLIALLGTAGMFTVSLIQEKCMARDVFNRLPYVVRIVVTSLFALFVLVVGGVASYSFGGGGFLYAGF